jgi:2-polyprenyl-3-methyl-5-hydroxy-6-metoxy-1,4-benzoquinol methylase
MRKENSKILAEQEKEYWFPYHYVNRMPENGFRQHFIDYWGVNYITTIDFMLRQIKSSSPDSVLDVGCGDGRLAREISLHFPDIQVTGIDYSKQAITLASAMNQDLPGLVFSNVNITEHVLSDKYEMAILMEVFEHIPIGEAHKFLSAIHRSLKKDGLLLMTVPHSNKPVEYKHFQHFTIESVVKYLSPHFNVIEVVPFEKRGLLRRFLGFIMANRFFIINFGGILKYIYKIHANYLFYCANEQQCQRIFIRARAK